ncbi:MAG TPA: hypothetical protein VNT31_09385, partial [Nocardioides sp.]|nr:hypothetical protein [Nocardioides sp.]
MSSPAALAQATTVADAASTLAASDWAVLDGADAMAAAEAIAAAKGFLDAGLLHVIDRLEDTGTLTEHGWTSAK